jgi:hypothetical protein
MISGSQRKHTKQAANDGHFAELPMLRMAIEVSLDD